MICFSMSCLHESSRSGITFYDCKIKILIQQKTTIFNFSVISDHKALTNRVERVNKDEKKTQKNRRQNSHAYCVALAERSIHE